MYIDSSFYSTQLFEEIQNSTAGLLLTTYLSVTEVGILHICLLSRQAYSVSVCCWGRLTAYLPLTRQSYWISACYQGRPTAYLPVTKAGVLHIYQLLRRAFLRVIQSCRFTSICLVPKQMPIQLQPRQSYCMTPSPPSRSTVWYRGTPALPYCIRYTRYAHQMTS